MRSLFGGFRDFVMRGNVVELAIAVVIGTAFTALVNGIVEGLLNPLVALVAGRNDLSEVWAFQIAGTAFRPGLAIDALITFLLVAAAVYFFIKMPLTTLARMRARDEAAVAAAAPAEPADVVLLREIRDLMAQGATARTGAATVPAVGADDAAATDQPGDAADQPGRHTR